METISFAVNVVMLKTFNFWTMSGCKNMMSCLYSGSLFLRSILLQYLAHQIPQIRIIACRYCCNYPENTCKITRNN
jgi:hypothetical protein